MSTQRHALITGAGGDLGKAIAQTLAATGLRVSLLGRTRETLQATQQALGDNAFVTTADITKPDDVATAFAAARQAFGPIHVLVNNAGLATSAPFDKTDLAMWQSMLDVNLTGSFLCMQEALADMQGQGFGRIVNIASTAGRTGYAYVSAYCASKHGLIGLTRSLAKELATTNITVNAVCPGYVDTDMTARTLANIVAKTGRSEKQALQQLVASNPQKRLIAPAEVAAAVAWLCEETACGVTGQTIMIDGGELA